MNTSDKDTNISIIKHTFLEALQSFGLIMLCISAMEKNREAILYFLFPFAAGVIYRLIKKHISTKRI